MNTVKQILFTAAVTLGLVWPASSFAQAATAQAKPEASAPASLTDGEIKKIDLDNGKLTIKHGPIKHLDMPGMTMVFTAKNKSLLANLKPGDVVKFVVVPENGKLVVTDIQAAQ